MVTGPKLPSLGPVTMAKCWTHRPILKIISLFTTEIYMVTKGRFPNPVARQWQPVCAPLAGMGWHLSIQVWSSLDHPMLSHSTFCLYMLLDHVTLTFHFFTPILGGVRCFYDLCGTCNSYRTSCKSTADYKVSIARLCVLDLDLSTKS